MNHSDKTKLRKHTILADNLPNQYITLTSHSKDESIQFEVSLTKEEMLNVYILLEYGLDPTCGLKKDTSTPVIIQANNYLKCKNLHNNNHTILREYMGNIVYISNIDNVVCSNETTPENSATLHELFREVTAIKANEAILLILSESTTMYHTANSIQDSLDDYKRKLADSEYEYRKLKKKLKKTKKALAHYSLKCLSNKRLG